MLAELLAMLLATSFDITVDSARGPVPLRITAPDDQAQHRLLLFSHGNFLSKDDYQPLAQAWADAGYVVVQPTHLDARVVQLAADDPRRAEIWRSRRDDLVAVLDRWPQIETALPVLRGRATPRDVIVAGHSYGGHTAELLLGARYQGEDLSDARIATGVLLAPPGPQQDLVPDWQARAPYLDLDFTTMRRPFLLVVGDHDRTVMTTRDWHWRAAPFERAPAGAKCRRVIEGADHWLGGIAGADHGAQDAALLARTVAVTLAYLESFDARRCP